MISVKVSTCTRLSLPLAAPIMTQFQEARAYFAQTAHRDRDLKVVWVDGPVSGRSSRTASGSGILPPACRVKASRSGLRSATFSGHEQADVIALHDCDIVTYDRILLGRLIEPVANPNNDFEFCKGYYIRISPTEHAMKGRVTRLFLYPL